tara:strand:+ start:397 stop:822 length:426 start_codon:yes stop_codon:yes gene_type:complete
MKNILYICILLCLISCTKQTIYSGKIINQKDLTDINFKNKENLISRMGMPSFIDTVEKKYFYYSEKKTKKSIFNNKLDFSYIFVFEFDESDNIIKSTAYDLKKDKDFEFLNEETENLIVKRGLIEKVFGGVGAPTELPTTP